MPVNHAAENVLGTMGTICWTVQLLPQLWHTYRSKSVEGLSEIFMLACGIAGATLGTYSVVQNLNIPLILQPQLFGVLCLVSWAQCQYYGHKRSRTTAVVMYIAAVVLLGGFEVGMIYAVRPSYKAGNMGPTQFFGIFSTVLISCGLLPQYYEIYKYKEVIGISLLFMTVDALGGVFNDLSLAFKGDFDVVAGITYSLVVVLDGGILLLALILNPIARRRRKRLAAEDTAASDVETPADTSDDGSRARVEPTQPSEDEKQESANRAEEEKEGATSVENRDA
ncbi:hypothetical protein BD311DRAFT_754599 [Dichomitus squalens]|uniref:PQ-loop-domain-containing protein n=1 Tax=Dichomitus squalens TaxID=114155 RepID=A0A4Q9MWA4_9APHY|nr:hypothetical protein BD311DRAFT_754599 [Dichomitus squalens]